MFISTDVALREIRNTKGVRHPHNHDSTTTHVRMTSSLQNTWLHFQGGGDETGARQQLRLKLKNLAKRQMQKSKGGMRLFALFQLTVCEDGTKDARFVAGMCDAES